jgi:uncharacterized circularly permuted ATP-grasp superfamily protein
VARVPGPDPEAVYRPSRGWDEALLPDGTPRPHAEAVMGALAHDPGGLAARVRDGLERDDVRFGGGQGQLFSIDPVPRVIAADEWELLSEGLAQRVRALDRFVADVYGPQRAIRERVVPAEVVLGARHYDATARSYPPPRDRWVGVAGLDVVRGADGRLLVLEDNTRTPSGIAYAMAARQQIQAALPFGAALRVRSVDDAPRLLAEAIVAGAPERAPAAPRAVVLSDGPLNSAWWEHRVLAGRLGIPVVTHRQLTLGGDRVFHDGRPIDVVYRRTDDASLHGPAGRLLAAPLRAGTLGVVNAFGTGVADDKLVHAYVEDLVRFYTGDEPILGSVRTYDLSTPGALEEALDRLHEIVVKPRSGSGGEGVVLGPHADPATLDALRAELVAAPERYVAQELVTLSTHPTVVDGELVPRHVDLRAFVFLGAGESAEVLPGGLTRVAMAEESMVVNSSQDGGAKDTWVLSPTGPIATPASPDSRPEATP